MYVIGVYSTNCEANFCNVYAVYTKKTGKALLLLYFFINFCVCIFTHTGSITPTVELNGLAMKRGEPAIYRPLDPKPMPNYRANYNFRGMFNQRWGPKTKHYQLLQMCDISYGGWGTVIVNDCKTLDCCVAGYRLCENAAVSFHTEKKTLNISFIYHKQFLCDNNKSFHRQVTSFLLNINYSTTHNEEICLQVIL